MYGVECDRKGCAEEADYRVFWPGAPPATLCTNHTLQAHAAADNAGVRVTSCALGSVFEHMLLVKMLRTGARV